MGASLHNGNGSRRGRKPPFTEINVTPFVDVMLVLLVIFMVTAPMMTAGINVELPQANSKPLAGQDEPITIIITSNGKVAIGKTEIELKDLQTKLAAIGNEKKDTRIFVRASKLVDYGRVMEVTGEVSAAGFTKVSFITELGNPAASKGK